MKRLRPHCLLVCAATFAAAAALAPGAACGAGLSLLDAVERARQHEPLWRAAGHAAAAGREQAVIGRSALLPALGASYSASRNRSDISNGVLTTHPEYSSRAGALSLRQSLFNVEAVARYLQGRAHSAGSAAQYEAAAQALILRVAGAYIDALYSDEQAALAAASRAMLVEQSRLSARLFEKGEGTRTEVLETQARLDLAEARLLEAADAQRSARATLAAMTGAEVTALARLGERVAPDGGERAEFAHWRAAALAANPELRAQAFGIEAAEADVLRARAAHLPRLDLVASYAKNDSDSISTLGQESTVRSVGLQLNLPLYAGGAGSAGARQSVANRERVMAERDARRDELLIALRKDYDQVAGSAARIAALERAVASARLLVHATGQSIKGGVRITLDLLTAQEQLGSAERDLVLARCQYLLATLRLHAGAGTLGLEQVRALDRHFH